MSRIPPFRLTTVPLAILSLGLVVFGVINFQQQRIYQVPDDKVSWVDTAQGVKAWIVERDGPGDRAGIREGDRLEAINGKPIRRAEDAARAADRAGVWSQATYDLVRNGEKFQTSLVLVPQAAPKTIRHFLTLVGLLYLFIGTFILLRRWTAPKCLHFYVFCLTSFVLTRFPTRGN